MNKEKYEQPFFNTRIERLKRKSGMVFREEMNLKAIYDSDKLPSRLQSAMASWEKNQDITEIYEKFSSYFLDFHIDNVIKLLEFCEDNSLTILPKHSDGSIDKSLIVNHDSVLYKDRMHDIRPIMGLFHDNNRDFKGDAAYIDLQWANKIDIKKCVFSAYEARRLLDNYLDKDNYGWGAIKLFSDIGLYYDLNSDYAVYIGDIYCKDLGLQGIERDKYIFRINIDGERKRFDTDKKHDELGKLLKKNKDPDLEKVITALEYAKGKLFYDYFYSTDDKDNKISKINIISFFGENYPMYQFINK